MTERDLVARDPVFFTWMLNVGCLLVFRLLNEGIGSKTKKPAQLARNRKRGRPCYIHGPLLTTLKPPIYF